MKSPPAKKPAAKPPPDDPEQSARFIDAARETCVDADGSEFKKAFNTIVPAKKKAVNPKDRS